MEVDKTEMLPNVTFTESDTPATVRAARMTHNISKGRADYALVLQRFNTASIHKSRSKEDPIIVYIIIETKQIDYERNAIAQVSL